MTNLLDYLDAEVTVSRFENHGVLRRVGKRLRPTSAAPGPAILLCSSVARTACRIELLNATPTTWPVQRRYHHQVNKHVRPDVAEHCNLPV